MIYIKEGIRYKRREDSNREMSSAFGLNWLTAIEGYYLVFFIGLPVLTQNI